MHSDLPIFLHDPVHHILDRVDHWNNQMSEKVIKVHLKQSKEKKIVVGDINLLNQRIGMP